MIYVMQVIGQEEDKTVDVCNSFIANAGWEFYVPKKQMRKHYQGAWKDITQVMFPGYVFIEANEAEIFELYERLREVARLTKILKTDYAPTPISEAEEKFIKRITNPEHVAEVSIGFIEGDKLTISEGPMIGMEASVVKINRHKRQAILSIEMFGKNQEITMGLEVLSKN